VAYDAGLFRAPDVERLAGHYETLLTSALEAPQTPVAHLDLLGRDMRQALLVDLNDTDASYPEGVCIHQLIEQQADRSPDALAVEFGDARLSYAELDERANRLAHHLRGLAVGPNVLVALCLDRSLDTAVAILGILKAGGAYVPIDPEYPRERISLILEDAGASVVVTREAIATELPEHAARVVCLDSDAAAIAAQSGQRPSSGVEPGDLVYVIYTSGTTGRPKGVTITHEGLVISNAARIAYFRDPVGKFLLLSPLAFDSSVVGLFWTLLTGGTLFLVPSEIQREPAQLAALIANRAVTHLLTLPSYYALLLEHAGSGQLDGLHCAIVAGEAFPDGLIDRHKASLASTRLFSEYGATETTVWCTVHDCLSDPRHPAPLGRPIDNARVYVLDANLEPVPVGVPGDLYLGGLALAPGYLNRAELTAEKFIPDPFAGRAGMRLYKSGDRARHLEGGGIEFLGRIDHQIKIRGYRVELEEIDSVLGQFPRLREAVVVARSRDGGDASGTRLVAYVVPGSSDGPTPGELREFLEQRLPDYMVPSLFVSLDDLPRSPNGKVDRRALPEPDLSRAESFETYTAPGTETEQAFAKIWAELLGMERIGINDNFFELGGDSILVIQAVARSNQIGLQLTPRDLFQRQTIAELASVAGSGRATPAEQGLVVGTVPITPIQRWFLERDLAHPDHANMAMLLETEALLDESRVEAVFQRLLEHHDALRIRLSRQGSDWVQSLAGSGSSRLVESVDLSACGESELGAAIEAVAARSQASLDLAQGPLLRATLFDLGAERPGRLLIVVHHLAFDGVSWRILLEDFQSAYRQLERGAPIELPPKTCSFKQWSESLRDYARSDSLREELDYWLTAGAASPPRLPLDRPNGMDSNTVASARTVSVSLDE
jgi:amino acid adenylation domain-containing protein